MSGQVLIVAVALFFLTLILSTQNSTTTIKETIWMSRECPGDNHWYVIESSSTELTMGCTYTEE